MTEIVAFTLVLLRLVGFVVTMPIFGTNTVPVHLKVLLALLLAMIVFPQVGWKKISADFNTISLITIAIKEVFIGLTFGFLARLYFMAVGMAGQIMSVSLGVSSAQLFNPAMGEVSTSFDQIFVTLASLFFLSINGHHMLISGLFDSYQIVPISKLGINLEGLGGLGPVTQTITLMALKFSAPVMVSILFMNIAVALVGRAVPQINILITSLPINILVGLFIVFFSLPLLLWEMTDLLNLTAMKLFQFIKSY